MLDLRPTQQQWQITVVYRDSIQRDAMILVMTGLLVGVGG